MEAHDTLGHQEATHTYCLIKCQYYWKGVNKDIRKYIANCTLCCREKAKVQSCPLQMTEIPDWPFDKIAVDLVTEFETFHFSQQACAHHHWSPHRMARSFLQTGQVSRYYSIHIYKSIPSNSHVPQIHMIRQWHGVQESINGSCFSTTQCWLHLFCTIPSSKQWEIRSLS